jgi:hypothetical protein
LQPGCRRAQLLPPDLSSADAWCDSPPARLLLLRARRRLQCLKPGVSSVVLDAEAVAWDREKRQVLPFQVLSTRSRKDVTLDSIKARGGGGGGLWMCLVCGGEAGRRGQLNGSPQGN